VKIGFTGTRDGLSDDQRATVRALLIGLCATELHHGDCIGADAEMHGIARELGLKVIGHPPIKRELRAYCSFDEEREPLGYFARNRAIVEETELLIGGVRSMQQQTSGGTWYTLDYAWKASKKSIVVWRDGSTEERVRT
jgi:hypothetical protein